MAIKAQIGSNFCGNFFNIGLFFNTGLFFSTGLFFNIGLVFVAISRRVLPGQQVQLWPTAGPAVAETTPIFSRSEGSGGRQNMI